MFNIDPANIFWTVRSPRILHHPWIFPFKASHSYRQAIRHRGPLDVRSATCCCDISPSVWLMTPRKHFVTKCFTASPFSPLLTPQSFFSPVIRCFSGAADSLWSLSRWVRCVQVTRHLTLRGFLLRGCDAASCCVILLTHLPVSFSVSRAARTSHSVHSQPTASTLTGPLMATEHLGKTFEF